MTEKLKQIIKREVEMLLKENQEVINNFGWEKITEEIGRKYLLSDGEINIFQAETLVVLVGLEDPDFYATNIENDIGTSKEEAKRIVKEIDEKVFTPINDVLIENLKKSEKIKNPKWDQNLNFIISGGNYHSFMSPTADDYKIIK